VALCARCGAVLERGRRRSLDLALALHLAALVMFLLANAFPLLVFRLRGTVQEATLPGCARILADLDWPWLAAVLATTVILAPMAHLAGMILVLFQLRRGRVPAGLPRALRLVLEFQGWGMVEVFVLSLVIAFVKLAQWAPPSPGAGLFALAAFMALRVLAASSLDPTALWNRLRPPPPAPVLPPGIRTARGAGLMACQACGLLSPLAGPHRCPRCDATLHSRKPRSRERTWALLLATALLYLPANLLPVMRTVTLGRAQEGTIFSGILHFAREGSWGLAAVIFAASVLVPLLKMASLAVLLAAESSRPSWSPRDRARLYRLTEAVGRWSMVDVFVVTLLVALVEAGGFASITPGPGAMAFALMVAAAIQAVRCFDPRLVWDALEPDHG
jgi:paraquat-inducible protein A